MSYQDDPPLENKKMTYALVGLVVLVLILMSMTSLISTIHDGQRELPTWQPAAIYTVTPQGMTTATPEGWWDSLATPTP